MQVLRPDPYRSGRDTRHYRKGLDRFSNDRPRGGHSTLTDRDARQND